METIYKTFYSHAPRGARRDEIDLGRGKYVQFLLTRPSRGATEVSGTLETERTISTHTPLAGRDRGRRLFFLMLEGFLLTRPSRGATATFSM